MNKHSGSTSKTFIVEDFFEDEFGQWATDEVTGERGYVDDEGSCFWTWDNDNYAWHSKPFRSRNRRKKVRANERTKVDQQETEERSLVKNKRTIRECGQKMVLGGPKENKERNSLAFQKVMKAIGKVDFAILHLERVQVGNFLTTQRQGEGF